MIYLEVIGILVYIEFSRGFEVPSMILHLRQYIYGLRQSPLKFYKYLREILEDQGCIKSSYDDCVFTNGLAIILFWVDDCVFYKKQSNY